MLLFVVYEVYITDIFGHEKQEKATAEKAAERARPRLVVGPAGAREDHDGDDHHRGLHHPAQQEAG